MQCWFVCWVEPLGSPRVDEIRGATRYYPKGAACAGGTDCAVLVDVRRHQAIHKVVLAHGATIGGELRYLKGGVMLADFTPASMQQGDLFAAQQQSQRSEALMQVIDKINQGRLGKVYFAARGRDTREWMMKWEQLSPRYTTALDELPVVK